MKAMLIAALALVTIQVSAGISSPPNNDGVLAGHPDNCKRLSDIAGDAAKLRDLGMPWAEFSPKLEEAIREAKKDKHSYVRDFHDEMLVRRLIALVWAMPKVTPDRMSELVFQACVRKTWDT
jgi:hypothetical protein